MTRNTRMEWLKIILIMAIALFLLNYFNPGLQDSPYNEF